MGKVGFCVALPLVRFNAFAKLSRFRRDEGGAMLVFGLFILVITLIGSGMAIDFMRHEAARVKMQTTLDRAVLAAADISQELDAEDVIEDHFEKAGLGSYGLDARRIGTKTVSYSEVSASATDTIGTFFLKLVGIDTLDVVVQGGAAERELNVEISMVLDISGTMAHYSESESTARLLNMQAAAKRFLALVLTPEKASRTSVNIIAYAGSVNPGEEMFDYLGGDRDHVESSCLEVTPTDLSSSGLPTGSDDQVPHFNYYPTSDTKYPHKEAMMDWGWCPSDKMAIQYASNDLDRLTKFIDNLRLHDGTGTHVGMKYGLALLEPSTQPFFSAQSKKYSLGYVDEVTKVAQPNIPVAFANRPAAWTLSGEEQKTQKYIVLMTDGNVSNQYRPKDPSDPTLVDDALKNKDADETSLLASASDNVTDLLALCNQAKSQDDIIIHAVAFDPSTSKLTQIREEMMGCASSTSTYYETYGEEIVRAFESIARTINPLRLTN